MDTNKITLPEGWFSDDNVVTYRRLVSQMPDKSTLVELGCWKGRSICSVADIILSKKLKVYTVDSFSGADNEIGQYGDVSPDDAYRIFQENLKSFNIFDVVTPIVMKTKDAVGMVHDISLLFIDADHSYEAVKQDIEGWLPEIRSAGVIAGHDFYRPGVSKALYESELWPVENEMTIWFKRV